MCLMENAGVLGIMGAMVPLMENGACCNISI